MIETRQTDAGTILMVKARPGGRANKVVGIRAGSLLVQVTAAPEKGKANAALVEVLAEVLHVAKRDIAIVKGEVSTSKQFLIAGLSPAEVSDRLSKCSQLNKEPS